MLHKNFMKGLLLVVVSVLLLPAILSFSIEEKKFLEDTAGIVPDPERVNQQLASLSTESGDVVFLSASSSKLSDSQVSLYLEEAQRGSNGGCGILLSYV